MQMIPILSEFSFICVFVCVYASVEYNIYNLCNRQFKFVHINGKRQ